MLRAPFRIRPSEERVLRLALLGMNTKEIASAADIAHWTVKRHLNELFRRAGLHGLKGKRVRLIGMVETVGEPVTSPLGSVPQLSKRMADIAFLVSIGYTNREIGACLMLGENTIRNYLREIFDICGVWRRQELAIWWRAHGERVIAATK